MKTKTEHYSEDSKPTPIVKRETPTRKPLQQLLEESAINLDIEYCSCGEGVIVKNARPGIYQVKTSLADKIAKQLGTIGLNLIFIRSNGPENSFMEIK